MTDQISITDFLADQTHDRGGNLKPAPEWMRKERCENCKYWEIFQEELQPPDGWGVIGQCNCSHEPQMMRNGYWKTGRTGYCQDYQRKELTHG